MVTKVFNEDFGKPTKRTPTQITETPPQIPIAGDSDGLPSEDYSYLDEVTKSFGDSLNLSTEDKVYVDRKHKPARRIKANALKGGSGAKWILHKKIKGLVALNYTRKEICKELDICRMTLYRHLYWY